MPASHRKLFPSKMLSNGVCMPMIGLGTTHSGGYYHDVVLHALNNCGYRMIDTARRYGVEHQLGIACQMCDVPRDELFLCSKLWPTDYGIGVSSAFEASCSKLQTEYLGMGNAKEVREETWRRMELLYENDRVRSIGVSNFSEADLEELMETCSIVPHVNQCEFHPWYNPNALRRFCDENDILFTGYCPIAKGRYLNNPTVTELAWKYGKSPAQICLRWSIENGVAVIPQSAHKNRVKQNTEIFDFSLSSEDMMKMEKLSVSPIKIVNTDDLQTKFSLPDGYKLKGRVFGVPTFYPHKSIPKTIPTNMFQTTTMLMSP